MVVEIEILRGLAILLVFVFHLPLNILPGGYLGVDVFYVLSGYLMAHLYSGISTPGEIRGFYEKRLKRILPAYFAALFVTVAVSALLLLPHEFKGVLGQGLWSAFLAPNFGFWTGDSYFDKTEFKPLLHFWSLGVELQFYAVFPLAAWIVRKSRVALGAIIVISYAACWLMAGVAPKSAFFLPMFRAWEFFIGYAAWGAANRAKFSFPPVARWGGLLFLAALAYLSTRTMDEAAHLQTGSLGACLLTGLVIIAGLPGVFSGSFAGAILRVLGRYSYSIYLVHFPVIVFLFHLPFGGMHLAPQPGEGYKYYLAVGLTAVLSFLSYRYVETPFRAGGARRWGIKFAVAALVSTLAGFLALYAVNRAAYSKGELLALDAWHDRGDFRCGALRRILDPFSASCALNASGKKGGGYLLVGDSHADSIKDVMTETARENGVNLRLMAANCALGAKDCSIAEIDGEVRRHGISTVILHSHPGAMKAGDIAELVKRGEGAGFDVVLVDPAPVWPFSVPKMLFFRSEKNGGPPPAPQSGDDYRDFNAAFFEGVARIDSLKFRRYGVEEYFCAPLCAVEGKDGRPYYFDKNHLTLTGAAQLRPLFRLLLK